MGKLFVIMGKSASGKDTIFDQLMKRMPEISDVVTYTTRPIRTGETHGREYYFVSSDELYELEEAGKVVECREYDTVHGPWFYFTVDDGQFDFEQKDYMMISTLEGFEKIRDFYGEDKVVPIYIKTEDFQRLERAMSREKEQSNPCAAEVCRRFLADEKDFSEKKLRKAKIAHSVMNDQMEQAIQDVIGLINNAR